MHMVLGTVKLQTFAKRQIHQELVKRKTKYISSMPSDLQTDQIKGRTCLST